MFILWFAVGFWHGGSWNYIIGSGLLHWFYIVFGKSSETMRANFVSRLKINTAAASFKFMQIIRTFTFVCIGFVFFRTRTLSDARQVFRSIFTENNPWIFFDGTLTAIMPRQDWTLVCWAIILLLAVDVMRLKCSLRDKIASLDIVSRWAIYFAAMFAILIFGIYGPGYDATKFIYGAI
jgi:hypothetical protein